jgi:hypothetical protein
MPQAVVSEKFKKREFVVTDESSQYPQDILFQTVQDKTTLLDKFKEGQEITVHFNLKGREWTSPTGDVKYFNTLECWRIEGDAQTTSTATKPATKASGKATKATPVIESVSDEDLPF